MRPPLPRLLLWASRACLAGALALAADVYATTLHAAYLAMAVRADTYDAAWRQPRASASDEPRSHGESRAGRVATAVRGTRIGELRIPAVGLAVAVVEGDDAARLRVAVGHLPDTPLPSQPGNSVLAGHRDMFFRPLARIRAGDEVQVTTAQGTIGYRITATRIVRPDDMSVVTPTPDERLTLITCYPFDFIGAAPQRFVVTAERIGGSTPALGR